MKILFIGDIFGHEGRRACLNEIRKLKEKYEIDLVIANAENTSNGNTKSGRYKVKINKFI